MVGEYTTKTLVHRCDTTWPTDDTATDSQTQGNTVQEVQPEVQI